MSEPGRWDQWMTSPFGLVIRVLVGFATAGAGLLGILVAYGLATLLSTPYEPTYETYGLMAVSGALLVAGVVAAVRPTRPNVFVLAAVVVVIGAVAAAI